MKNSFLEMLLTNFGLIVRGMMMKLNPWVFFKVGLGRVLLGLFIWPFIYFIAVDIIVVIYVIHLSTCFAISRLILILLFDYA